MNRIILIGNGFDLAHGLETKYTQFIDDYWKRTILEIRKTQENRYINVYENNEFSLKLNVILKENLSNYSDLFNELTRVQDAKNRYPVFKNQFFKIITEQQSLQNWVDIENTYYFVLKEFLKTNASNTNIKKLNEDFKAIENLLVKYLTDKEKEIPNKIQEKPEFVQSIGNIIYSDISLSDLIEKGRSQIEEFTFNKFIAYRNYFMIRAGDNQVQPNVDPDPALAKLDQDINKRLFGDLNHDNWKRVIKESLYNGLDSVKFALEPDSILFLTFNYTNTEEFYTKPENVGEQGKDCQVIHVHGSLDEKDKNPIIFGFGDELDDDYKLLEKANNNEYLENIKSIKYLETSNYKQLLNFINADQYQVFIFGHSCGISDRTLLNTLFEHENCVSIKPFYHKIDDTRDNYSDIVRNISRNFNNKASMRDKVVNKTYCEPLGGK